MKYTGVIISDIHIGAMNASEISQQLDEVFFKTMEKMDKLDFIVVCGDFFDFKLYLNSHHSEVAVRTMNKIYNIAKEKNAKVRIIYGTESHESNQYHIFDDLTRRDDVDFKIIYTVQEEELFSDMKVLYLPEEFVLDKREYYSEYFDKEKEYDYIFGHGIIQEVMTNVVRYTDTNKSRAKPPVFTTADLSKMCKGQCFFGHYHIHVDITDSIFYVGSYSRWIYGEEPDKGFFITEKDGDKFGTKFIINDYADKYITKAYGYDNKIFSFEDEFVKEMESVSYIINSDSHTHVRIMVNIPEDLPWANFIIEFLKGRFSTEDRVKVNVVNGFIDKKEKADKEQISEILDKYDFIFNRDMKLEDKCQQFIKIKFNTTLDIERIRNMLYDELKLS